MNFPEIVEIALGALRESVVFLRHILENEGYCNQVLNSAFLLFNSEHRGKVYEFLFEFGRHCYHMLPAYIKTITQATVAHMGLRNEDSILALELWDTIGTEYLRADFEKWKKLFAQLGIKPE